MSRHIRVGGFYAKDNPIVTHQLAQFLDALAVLDDTIYRRADFCYIRRVVDNDDGNAIAKRAGLRGGDVDFTPKRRGGRFCTTFTRVVGDQLLTRLSEQFHPLARVGQTRLAIANIFAVIVEGNAFDRIAPCTFPNPQQDATGGKKRLLDCLLAYLVVDTRDDLIHAGKTPTCHNILHSKKRQCYGFTVNVPIKGFPSSTRR